MKCNIGIVLALLLCLYCINVIIYIFFFSSPQQHAHPEGQEEVQLPHEDDDDVNFHSFAAVPPGSGQSHPVFLVFLTPTTLDQVQERMRIRTTYAQCQLRAISHFPIRHIFYVGGNSSAVGSRTWDEFHAERSAYHDIVFDESVLDSYRNLSLKMIRSLKWAVTYHPQAVFVVKVDVDVVIHLPRLLERFITLLQSSKVQQQNHLLPIVMGMQVKNWPDRNNQSKWYVSPEEFGPSVYPVYSLGPIYALSRTAVQAVLGNFQIYANTLVGMLVAAGMKGQHGPEKRRPILPMEDVLITGVLLEKVPHLLRVSEKGFCQLQCSKMPNAIAKHRGWVGQLDYSVLNCADVMRNATLIGKWRPSQKKV